MRRITIPAEIIVRGATVAYFHFIRHLLDTDDRFNRTGAGIRLAVRIEQTLKAGAPYHHVEQTDWEILKQVVEAPVADGRPAGYVELVARTPTGDLIRKEPVGRAVLPFIDAVLEAEVVEVLTAAPNGATATETA